MNPAIDFFLKGGPVMWPILIVSIIGLGAALERFAVFAIFFASNRRARKDYTTALEAMQKGDWTAAEKTLKSRRAPIARMLREALAARADGFCERLQASASRELELLKRRMALLDTAITVAPMLGILGTVTGIINTFSMLNASGMDNPQAATSGIAEALITTAAGLVAAIVCLLPYNSLRSLLRRATSALEQCGTDAELAYNRGSSQK